MAPTAAQALLHHTQCNVGGWLISDMPEKLKKGVPNAAQARPVRTGTLPSWCVAGAVMAAWVAC